MPFPALFLLAVVATPQDPRPIPEDPSCRACEIVIGPRQLTVSDPSPVTGTKLDAFITALASGHYLAGSGNAPPQLFDASGHFVRPLGNKGKGPREFTMSTVAAVGPGDSVAVIDRGTARVSIFDRQLRFVRDWTITQAVIQGSVLWLPEDAGLLMSGPRATGSDVLSAVHRYASDGSYRGSIAENPGPSAPNASMLESFRVLARSSATELVTLSVATTAGAYRIERWDLSSGRLQDRWERKSKWIETTPGPFPSRVKSAWVDSTGLLWTLLTVRAPDWEKAVESKVIGTGERTERAYMKPDLHRVADALIEVIDLRSGRLVAQARFDRVYRDRLANGLLAAESEDEWGLDLFPVSLRRP